MDECFIKCIDQEEKLRLKTALVTVAMTVSSVAAVATVAADTAVAADTGVAADAAVAAVAPNRVSDGRSHCYSSDHWYSSHDGGCHV